VQDYADGLTQKPVVFPTNDRTALMLTRHRDALQDTCIIWNNTYELMASLVQKDLLYRIASSKGVPVPPSIVEPDVQALRDWCADYPPPYLAKPYYESIQDSVIQTKNMLFSSANDMLDFVAQNGSTATIIQQMIVGGDGWVFDCYGLCDANGKIRTLASHKRIRQNPPNFGVTSYGEIPGIPAGLKEEAIFDLTHKLLSGVGYHGIFGVEWLQCRKTKKLFLVDFNARPFLTVGHVRDCGLNLPLLAYREMLDGIDEDFPMMPPLKHKFWIACSRDINTVVKLRGPDRPNSLTWIRSLLQARSFAVWKLRDPLPFFDSLATLLRQTISYLTRTFGGRFRRGEA
jgi:predicted ATP-grasp superfamily ATP-dependent carboligase